MARASDVTSAPSTTVPAKEAIEADRSTTLRT